MPRYSIGRQDKGLKYGHFAPGPGAYEPKGKAGRSMSSPPAYTMRKKFDEKRDPNFPGPAEYSPNIKNKMKAPSYTMRKKTAYGVANKNPGPAAYQPDFKLTRETKVSAKVGTEAKCPDWDNRKYPGPGTYEQDQNAIKHSPPKRRFGTEKRMGPNLEKLNPPGAGQYEYETELEQGLRKNKGKTLGAKRKDPRDWKVPGPGTYEQGMDPLRLRHPKYSIPKDSREKPNKEKLGKPGPGTYDPNVAGKVIRDPQWGFGTDARKPLYDEKHTPGAGAYENDRRVGEGPKYSMALKLNDPKGLHVPGAGTYNPSHNNNSVKETAPRYGIGTQKRPDLHNTDKNPGPADYNQDQNAIKHSPPKRRFGTEKRMGPNLEKLNPPGAGQYDYETELEQGLRKNKGKTLGAKRKDPRDWKVPGPGTYEQGMDPLRLSHPKYSIPKDSRVKVNKEKMAKPGPGTYDPNVAGKVIRDPQWGFGTDARKPLYDEKHTPGPGNYNSYSKLGHKPRFAMGIKLRNNRRFNTPGAGTYHPKHTKNSVKEARVLYSFGKSKRKGFHVPATPGPGNYNQDQDAIKIVTFQKKLFFFHFFQFFSSLF